MGLGLAYPAASMARKISTGIVASAHDRIGRGSLPPRVVML